MEVTKMETDILYREKFHKYY